MTPMGCLIEADTQFMRSHLPKPNALCFSQLFFHDHQQGITWVVLPGRFTTKERYFADTKACNLAPRIRFVELNSCFYRVFIILNLDNGKLGKNRLKGFVHDCL
jgi:hypothetical protein